MKSFINLTLLLPVYNGGEGFHKILSSLEGLNRVTNVIIYNDGSNDNSYQVSCHFSEKSKHKVRVIDGRKNRGYFRSIKILLKICPTDFFIFLGHDDRLSKNYLDEFDVIISEQKDVACIFTDVATITPQGITTNTWPNAFSRENAPSKMLCVEAVKTFHKHEWGNLFVGIWSKHVLSHKTLLQGMKCIPDSPLVSPLKRSGFMNDNMAVLRALSFNGKCIVFYNKKGIYFKEVDPRRISEGSMHSRKFNVLHSPLGYLAVVSQFMLPQIKQKGVATLWVLRYLYIYFGIFAKMLLCNPGSLDISIFLQGLGLILTGYVTNISAARGRAN